MAATYTMLQGFGLFSLCFLVACGRAGSSGMDAFERRLLQAIAEDDDFRNQLCVPVAVGRPVDRGFEGIRFEAVPGAHRVVIANGSGNNWRMVDGYPAMLLFTSAGFLRAAPLDVNGPEGVTVPAVAFELTQKGFEAMGLEDCFPFGKPKSVRVYTKEQVDTLPQANSIGKTYRIHYALQVERLPWADTPEFTYVYTSVFNTLTTGLSRTGVFVDTGKEMLSGSRIQAAMMQRAAPRNKSEGTLASPLAGDEVRKLLEAEEGRTKLAPCLEIPLRGLSAMEGLNAKDAEVAAVFHDTPASGQHDPNRAAALEFYARLQKAGLAKLESPGGLVRYRLEPSITAAMRSSKRYCLPLGEAKIETLATFGSPARTGFRGWASVASPAPWSSALAGQFPGVAAAMREGFGVQGSIRVPPYASSERIELDARAKLLQFGEKPRPYANAFVPFSAERVKLFRERRGGEAAVDKPGYESKVSFDGKQPCVSVDGSTVTSGKNRSCHTYRVSRGYTGGKLYAELSFASKLADGKPNTWTNAAFTTQRSLSSLSSGAAHFSFAGSFTKQLIKGGDLIGVAADLDDGVIYWHVNGMWHTGRPGSGLGAPILEMGTEHFLAVSVQGGNQGEIESWSANFGDYPFKYPAPEGFRSYGGKLQ